MKLGNIQTKKSEKQQKKASPASVIAIGIGMMVMFAALMVYILCTKMDQLTGNVTDIYDAIDNGTLKAGAYVSLDMKTVLGNYAEMTDTSNVAKSTREYYIIWLDDDSFISLSTTSSSVIDDLEDMTADTWAYLAATSNELPEHMEIKGTVTSMTDTLKGYYDEALTTLEVSEDEYTIYALDIMEGDDQNEYTGWLVFCGVMIVIGIIILVIGVKQKKKQTNVSNSEKNTEEKSQQMKTLEEEQLERIANPAFDENPENTENQ